MTATTAAPNANKIYTWKNNAPSLLNKAKTVTLSGQGQGQNSARVCFPASGSLRFYAAGDRARDAQPLDAYSVSGLTCAQVSGPGTVLLLPGPPAPPFEAVSAPAARNRQLQNCRVWTRAILKFRAEPGGAIIGLLPYAVTLTALARTADWFKVDYHGAAGWISAAYVRPQGTCD